MGWEYKKSRGLNSQPPPFNLLSFRRVPPGFRQVSAGFRRVPPGSAEFRRVLPGSRLSPAGSARFGQVSAGCCRVSANKVPTPFNCFFCAALLSARLVLRNFTSSFLLYAAMFQARKFLPDLCHFPAKCLRCVWQSGNQRSAFHNLPEAASGKMPNKKASLFYCEACSALKYASFH